MKQKRVGVRSHELCHFGHPNSPLRNMCSKHRRYTGLRKPTTNCAVCLAYYAYNRIAGVIEAREIEQ